MKRKAVALLLSAGLLPGMCAGAGAVLSPDVVESVAGKLSEKYPDEKGRAVVGVKQVAELWTAGDGSEQDFAAFCQENFYAGASLKSVFMRFNDKMEKIKGYNTALEIELHREMELDTGALLPVDTAFAGYNPSVNVVDDMFRNKLAFSVLLNFPVRSFEEKSSQGAAWTREQWAQARLVDKFEFRVPSGAGQKTGAATAAASAYINDYNIYMDRVVGDDGQSLFRPGNPLISHWGLRDELIGMYANPSENIARQETIYKVMERIVAQEIPAQVVNSSAAFWNPGTNLLDGKPAPSENDARYARWLSVFNAVADSDKYYPSLPTHIARTFKRDIQLDEVKVERLLVDLLKASEGARTAKLMEKRLGRKLRPFDIWYDGFRARPSLPVAELDKLVAEKYPTLQSFQNDLPQLLEAFGFSKEKAAYVATRVQVDPARGGGHAYSAEMLGEKAHLRARFPGGKLDWQNFVVSLHELGHAVEGTFSVYNMDYALLNGVPNSALSEAFAFIFQGRDYSMMGVKTEGQDLRTLDMFWNAREIAGVALVDLYSWRWLYAHPAATPAELKQAVTDIAKEVWNKYYASAFGVKDSPVFAIYSHLVMYSLYLPNYPLGYLAAAQIEEYMKGKNFGAEMERMCSTGNVTPAQWMKAAVGEELSAKPLIRAASAALSSVK